MATYCFKCPECGNTTTLAVRDREAPECFHIQPGAWRPEDAHPVLMVRDYRAENVGVHTLQLKKEREAGGVSAIRDLMLPTAAEMATPEDPNGQKALQDWNERHVPAATNTRPVRPETDKRVF